MTHINNIGAGLYSDLSVSTPASPEDIPALLASATLEQDLKDLFVAEKQSTQATPATGDYVRITNVREFPSMGTPPNIVNVPVYGQATSQQIQGQSDAPSIELTLNYIASDWGTGTRLGDAVGNGTQYVFRFTLLNADPETAVVGGTYDSDTSSITANTSLAEVQNSMYFWVGKIEALQVNPQLTDANTATVTISIQSDFFGAFTINT